MKRQKQRQYHINPVTLALEHVEHGLLYWLKRSGYYLLGGICLGVIFFFLFYHFLPSPRERQLIEQKKQLESQIKLIDNQVNQMQVVMADLSQRDDNLYRVLLGAEPIPIGVRQGATKKMSYYDELAKMTDLQLAADLALKADILEKELYVQAKSYDEILQLAKTQELRMENIPAIQPVLNKNLTRVASGYGWRIDPVYHVRRFHDGMDFTAPRGTDVFATGNGKVTFVGHKQGYGNTVIVDHGFGYETLYAHLYKSLCRVGQKVKRADVIALVGNTGKSTGPHLHYEVHYHGKPIDPRNYYFYDLTPEEYDRMVQLSNNFGHMLD
ncbi:MAG: M23 family metallopeptidase [Paludibacteraceae bacterium]|nr:M23 family metallopeptidase [Paludibacteraceae bacterium]